MNTLAKVIDAAYTYLCERHITPTEILVEQEKPASCWCLDGDMWVLVWVKQNEACAVAHVKNGEAL